MHHFGIIGLPLEHSFSARYFAEKFRIEQVDADYQLYPLTDLSSLEDCTAVLAGFNVTYPYKETIIPKLKALDVTAQEIGAINVVCNQIGYNTDWIGFHQSLQKHLTLDQAHKALILGSGGVSKAVQYALKHMGIPFDIASRHATPTTITYDELTYEKMQTYTIIVNCTPLGMYPNTESKPEIPYQAINSQHLLYDCVYNPEKTLFLLEGEKQGATIINGLEMLYLQADEAWKIWQQQLNIAKKKEQQL